MATLARDIMERNAVTIPFDMPVLQVQHLFVAAGISGAPVVDANGAVIGLISAVDLLRAADQAADEDLDPDEVDGATGPPRDALALDLASRDVLWVSPDTPVDVVAQRMWWARFHRVLVGDGATLEGILTTFDLLDAVRA